MEKWAVTFDDKIKEAINNCCKINSPYDTNLQIPEDENLPTELEEGNLLNESLNIYDGDCLASLSPKKRQSYAETPKTNDILNFKRAYSN